MFNRRVFSFHGNFSRHAFMRIGNSSSISTIHDSTHTAIDRTFEINSIFAEVLTRWGHNSRHGLTVVMRLSVAKRTLEQTIPKSDIRTNIPMWIHTRFPNDGASVLAKGLGLGSRSARILGVARIRNLRDFGISMALEPGSKSSRDEIQHSVMRSESYLGNLGNVSRWSLCTHMSRPIIPHYSEWFRLNNSFEWLSVNADLWSSFRVTQRNDSIK